MPLRAPVRSRGRAHRAARKRDLGGRFENFIFRRREYVTILTFPFLEELLMQAARGRSFVRPTRETRAPALFDDCLKLELESDFQTPRTLIVEARKP